MSPEDLARLGLGGCFFLNPVLKGKGLKGRGPQLIRGLRRASQLHDKKGQLSLRGAPRTGPPADRQTQRLTRDSLQSEMTLPFPDCKSVTGMTLLIQLLLVFVFLTRSSDSAQLSKGFKKAHPEGLHFLKANCSCHPDRHGILPKTKPKQNNQKSPNRLGQPTFYVLFLLF